MANQRNRLFTQSPGAIRLELIADLLWRLISGNHGVNVIRPRTDRKEMPSAKFTMFPASVLDRFPVVGLQQNRLASHLFATPSFE